MKVKDRERTPVTTSQRMKVLGHPIVCDKCKSGNGTLIKVDGKYYHASCK